jgi:histidinol-phosphatase (PHP family)
MASEEWKVSLHGGHSGEFCEHAASTLREVLEAAVAFGYHTFGVSEHAPRSQERFLYPSEREKGYSIERLRGEFEAYAEVVETLAEEFAGRLVVLRGFEAEVVPADGYQEEMPAWRSRFDFDYMVGSVHYVDETSVDGEKAEFDLGVERAGGLETYAIRYYETVGAMVEALRPDVVGHLDLIRKNASPGAVLDTPPIREAAQRALHVIKKHDCILDLNTAGYRKGLGSPYPAPWLVRLADEMGIGFCFGDDSHGPAQVGEGLDRGREYLVENGVYEISVLTREAREVVKKRVRLPLH